MIEMLLIKDHSRMKTATTSYDSTHPQQFRLLPVSHPKDWAAAADALNPNPGDDGQETKKR
ncbi:hypothetical protein [Streptomyces sp. NPDC085932]|uniref:hypothetical protein n=1 Tax=Streptomyces sp. NPDC085932 TaxID=3365741 RepID=UPI0037D66C55